MQRTRVVAATVALLAAIVGTTAAVIVVAHRQLDARLEAHAASAAATVREDLQLNLRRDVAAAVGLARSLGAVTALDGDGWTAAIGELTAAGAFGELSAASVLVVATDEDLDATVASLAPSVRADLHLRLSEGPLHAIGTVTWPVAGNAAILGYDVFRNEVAAAAARAAIRWGRVQASPPVRLVQGPDARDATVVYVPIAAPEGTTAEGTGGTAGLISLVFRAERLLADTVDLLPPGTRVRWADRSVGSHGGSTELGAVGDEVSDGAEAVELLVEFGRSYRIEVEVPRSALGTVERRVPLLIGVLGGMLLVSTVLLLGAWRRTAERADARVTRRTSDLLATTAELERANQELRELDRFKDRMLGTVSHDLRSPLTVIRGAAQVLLSRPDLTETQRRDLLTRLLRQTSRLRGLVDELLVSAQVRAGALRPDRQRVALEPLVATTTTDLGVGELQDGPPVPEVVADPVHVERVLHNLLMNAAHHGRPPVEVTLRAAGDTVEIAVRDHGDGVPDDLRDAVFSEHARAADAGPGYGLGLAIATELARANDGALTYRDPATPGACFVLSLPAAPVEER